MNNDRTVMSWPYAWRILGCLPILKGSAWTNTSKHWQAQRSMALYHSAMANIIPELNAIRAISSAAQVAGGATVCTVLVAAADGQ